MGVSMCMYIGPNLQTESGAKRSKVRAIGRKWGLRHEPAKTRM